MTLPPPAMALLACLLPLAVHGQIIMQTTTPDDMTGAPIEFGTSASGISLSNPVENPATPASAQPMVLGDENPVQPRPFTPDFDVSERYSLESTKEKDNQAPVPAQTPTPSPLTPNGEPQAGQATTTQPAQNSQNILLGQPQPALNTSDWQGNDSTISATQPFTLSPESPASLSLQPDPTPAASE